MVTSFGKTVEDQTATEETVSTDKYFLVRLGSDGQYTGYSITDQNVKKKRLVEKTANYTATAEDEIILVDATSGVVTISFPTADGIDGVSYLVKKIDSGGNAITLNPAGAETIEGSSTKTLSSQWDYMQITAYDGNWIITASG